MICQCFDRCNRLTTLVSQQNSPTRESAQDDASNRRNPRRGAATTYKGEDAEEDVDEGDYENEEGEENGETEVEEEPSEKVRGRRGKKKEEGPEDSGGARRSARSTKYQASLKEPNGESIRDLFVNNSTPPSNKRKGRSRTNSVDDDKTQKRGAKHLKSPAVRHKAVRRQVKMQVPISEDDWSEEVSDDEEEEMETDEEELKIQRVIATRSERRRVWKEICDKINTSEIESGSRWYEDNDQDKDGDEDTFEERFLVKWDDLSHLHCSWETQGDLVEQLETAKNYLSTFFRKSENGLLFSADERCDGDYFDPAYTQVERILEVELPDEGNSSNEYGMIMDKSHADYDSGTGRQFLIKWGSTPYSDCTYEFERDLIVNEVDYEEHVEQFYKRSKKVSSTLQFQLFIRFFSASNVRTTAFQVGCQIALRRR